jgi:hypothetical protein
MRWRDKDGCWLWVWRGFLALAAGAVVTVVVASVCGLWSPERENIDRDRVRIVLNAPDGDESELDFRGIGWAASMTCHPNSLIWHKFSGWPFYAMWSRVTPMYGAEHGEALYRWELPWDEIIHRGVGSQDFPRWAHVQFQRRLALLPAPWGFAGDTLVYGAGCWALGWAWHRRRQRRDAQRRGFPVICPNAAPSLEECESQERTV